jgi:hypothetical protein
VIGDEISLTVLYDDSRINPGRTVLFTFALRNETSGQLSDISVSATVPQYTNFVAEGSSSGWQLQATNRTAVPCPDSAVAEVICTATIALFPPNQFVEIDYALRIDPAIPDDVSDLQLTLSVDGAELVSMTEGTINLSVDHTRWIYLPYTAHTVLLRQ